MEAFYRLASIAAVVAAAGLTALSGAGAATASECPPGSTPVFDWGPNGQNTVCDTHGVDPQMLIPPASAPPYVAPAPAYVAPAPAPAYVAPAPVYVAPAPAPVIQAPAPINNEGSVTTEQQPSAVVPNTVADEAAVIQAQAEETVKARTDTEAAAKAQQDAEATAKASSPPTASTSAPPITKASVNSDSSTGTPTLIYVIGGVLAGVLLLGSAAGIWLKWTGRTMFSSGPWKRSEGH